MPDQKHLFNSIRFFANRPTTFYNPNFTLPTATMDMAILDVETVIAILEEDADSNQTLHLPTMAELFPVEADLPTKIPSGRTETVTNPY
ncbi:MAG: hypothetical protein GY774_00700 [Planctomycetes bacterium]|nr:hypothetical protein [Planctomycetota bacterium]